MRVDSRLPRGGVSWKTFRTAIRMRTVGAGTVRVIDARIKLAESPRTESHLGLALRTANVITHVPSIAFRSD